jgi:glycosyltransferase involved in cell wall biosynthesis
MISILIPAYKTSEYIEECLDSVQMQNLKIEYEIIVGVDCCQETLNELLKIRHKYNNLRIIMLSKNSGLFINLNTLITLTKYNNIIKFDSDDIMLPNFIEKMIKTDGDFVRCMFFLYYGKDKEIKTRFNHALGVFFIKKCIYEFLGGYQPWKCSADTEFIIRFDHLNKFKQIKLNEHLFYYRQHENSLTNIMSKEVRWNYHQQFRSFENLKINPITCSYQEI